MNNNCRKTVVMAAVPLLGILLQTCVRSVDAVSCASSNISQSSNNGDTEKLIYKIFTIGPDNGLHIFENVIRNDGGGRSQASSTPNPNGKRINQSAASGILRCGNAWTGSTFCTNVTNYDLYFQNNDFQLNLELAQFSSVFLTDSELPMDFASRSGTGNGAEYFCKSEPHIIYPQGASNIDGDETVIVNMPGRWQPVTVEVCSGANSPCRYKNLVPFGQNATCKQYYQVREMIAGVPTPSGKLEQVKSHRFKTPSCCKCVIRK